MEPLVIVDNLSQSFKKHKVLKNIGFQVNKGDFFLITGPSGAGKTTLISILAGIQAYKAGSVEIFGFQLNKEKEKHKPYIGLVTQETSLFNNFTVKENLLVLGMLRGMPSKYLNERIAWEVESFQLEDYFAVKLRKLPEGIKKRVALAGALLSEPRLLLLDDLFIKSDYHSVLLMMKNIYDYLLSGNTCILTTGSIKEADNLTVGSRGLAGLATTFGGLEPELNNGMINTADIYSLADQLCPKQVAYLNQGEMRVISTEEFNAKLQAMESGDLDRGGDQD